MEKNKKFGNWLVLKYSGRSTRQGRYYLCKCCECFVEKEIRRDHLTRNKNKCRECELIRVEAKKRENAKSPEMKAYLSARQRCQNPNSKDYPNYGGRGIEFRYESFEQFIADVGRKELSIDRIDNDGHYEPGNCRWATRSTQQKNKRVYTKN